MFHSSQDSGHLDLRSYLSRKYIQILLPIYEWQMLLPIVAGEKAIKCGGRWNGHIVGMFIMADVIASVADGIATGSMCWLFILV